MTIWRKALHTSVPALIVVAALIVAWQLAVDISGVRPQLLPSPARVAEQGWSHRSDLFRHARATLSVTLLGFAVSLSVAWLLAVAIDFSTWLRRALTPVFVVSQTIPIIVIAPLLILWFGFDTLPKVLLVTLTTFFPVAIGLIEGFAAADREASALLRSMGAARWTEFRYVRLPSAMPRFFTALRIGVTYAVVGAVYAESAGARVGLGIYMLQQKNMFRTDLVLAAVFVTAFVSVALYVGTYAIEAVIAPWALQSK